jgi:hypothetical protein
LKLRVELAEGSLGLGRPLLPLLEFAHQQICNCSGENRERLWFAVYDLAGDIVCPPFDPIQGDERPFVTIRIRPIVV